MIYEITYWNADGFRRMHKYSTLSGLLEEVQAVLDSDETDRIRIEKYTPIYDLE